MLAFAVSAASQDRLKKLVGDAAFDGYLPPAEVKELAAREGRGLDALMVELLPLAQGFARPPVSNFRVGAVARSASGAFYFGANVEVPGNSLGATVHAEQSAVANAYMHGESIVALAVTAAPCGHCRQFLYEFAGGRDLPVFLKSSGATRLSELLPAAFGPKDLGLADYAAPNQDHPLVLSADSASELAGLALAAARRAYAPYSKSPAGVAVRTKGGRRFSGSYLENAAFNPSLPPLQVALVGMALSNQPFGEIASVVLVELEKASISQEPASRAVLAAIAPKAEFHVLHARSE